MGQIRSLGGCLAMAAGVLAAAPAQAASLQRVDEWSASGVPDTTSMYIYVPDNVAPNPPILVVAHFCGGTAGAVFGQVQGGGIVAAADQYGFILLLPQTSNNCWDVGSTASLTHDGGGETQAVAEMVKYAITEYGANAERVYITGDSSGGMMTQAMLAVYPELFKGGSEFAGVPAGCWAVGNPDGSWSGQCAGGDVTHSGQEWGDIVRAMYPEYTGRRPRVQLFHGDADTTIDYQNHEEAIKQWTDVLALSAEPTSTDTVQLGSHQATRERWENACGYVVLEAFTSQGGDHGPSDAIFDASYVIPFLGLDNTDATDPEVAECESSGAGGAGSGGATSSEGGSAGVTANGGTSLGGSGGTTTGGASVGGANVGGEVSTGGVAGGSVANGGMAGDGATAAGGTPATSGPVGGGVGGATPVATAPSAPASGGSGPAATQVPPTASATSASGGAATIAPATSQSGMPVSSSADKSGSSCSVPGGDRSPASVMFLALSSLLLLGRRRGVPRRKSRSI